MTDIPGDAAPPTGSAPPPPPPPPARRLSRSRHGRMIWGVAAGLGDYFGIDPIVFRIIFVVLTLTGGAGVLLYVIALLLMPRDRDSAPAAHDVMRRFEHSGRHRWSGLILIAVAVGLILSNVHGVHFGVVWGLALIAIGVLLFQAESPWSPAPAGPGPGAPPASAESAAVAGGAPPSWSTPSWGGGHRPYRYPGGWHPGLYRSGPPIALITVALTLVAIGVAVMLGNAGVISLTVGSTLAIALTVLGAGLMVGAFAGRGRAPLILLGMLLIPVVGAGSLVDEPLGGGTGDRVEVPTSPDRVHSEYDLAAGRLTVDLSTAQLGSAPATVRATVAFGELLVRVPRDLPVTVHGRVGGGHMELLGRVDDGLQIRDDVTSTGSATQSPLTLDLGVGLGQIRVVRADATGATL